jgi:hypothetical protein
VGSFNSAPTIRDNCLTINPTTGHCATDCSTPPSFGIAGSSTVTAGVSGAVLLNTSPGASIETSTLCGAQGTQAIGVRIVGDATGTVIHGSSISASAGTTSSFGILAEDCSNAAPWIVGNELIQGLGSMRAAGILSRGTCDPVIDGNVLITGGGDTSTTESNGISCEANGSNEGSRCAVLGNGNVKGSSTSMHPTLSTAVACKDNSCNRVADNLVNGVSGHDVVGILLRNSGGMVEQNQITGGCGDASAIGILADDAFARVQNNLVSAGACTTALTVSPLNVGVRILANNDLNEMDVNSNTIDGGGNSLGVCTSTGVELGVGSKTAPVGPKGILRNNIMRGGACILAATTTTAARTDFSEARATTDPRLFQNNDLDSSGTPAPTLYLDEGTTVRNSAGMINGLPDITTSGNISANPMFVSPTDLHLGTGSACIGAGTPNGGPTTDLDGKARSPTKPSIGAYE